METQCLIEPEAVLCILDRPFIKYTLKQVYRNITIHDSVLAFLLLFVLPQLEFTVVVEFTGVHTSETVPAIVL